VGQALQGVEEDAMTPPALQKQVQFFSLYQTLPAKENGQKAANRSIVNCDKPFSEGANA